MRLYVVVTDNGIDYYQLHSIHRTQAGADKARGAIIYREMLRARRGWHPDSARESIKWHRDYTAGETYVEVMELEE